VRPGDLVDEWGNLSALRRSSAGKGGRFSGMLGRLSQAEIANSGETLGESMRRTERETLGETITRAKTRAGAMRRGEIWWYEHPDFKARPAAIVSPEEAIESIEKVYVVFATKISGQRSEVEVEAEVEVGVDEGMPSNCVLAADQIDVADKVFLIKPMTTLSNEKVAELAQALDPIPS
jgi:mRNA-degrading endonuclease toxin of MazEF toxin-antitoxin module